jgi:hypothetical protein
VLRRLSAMLANPLAAKSIVTFKALLQSQRLRPVHDVITSEFEEFDRRIREGDVAMAIAQLLQSRSRL